MFPPREGTGCNRQKRTGSDLSWGPHPLVFCRFPESEIWLPMIRRVWAIASAYMPRRWPQISWTQGSLNARTNGRQARALDLQARPSLRVHAFLLPCVPSRRKPVPSKYLCAEPRIAQPGLGDPGPLGSRLAALYLSRRPRRVRLGPGLLGEFYVLAHGACERRCK